MSFARAPLLLLSLTLLYSCGGSGCGGCGAPYLAEAAEVHVEVQRDFAASREDWEPCEAGERFRLGDGLRTGEGASVLLRMQPSGEVLVQERTTLRFERSDEEGTQRLDLLAGSVEVESAGMDLEIANAEAITRIGPRSRVVIRSEQGQASLVVLAGRAVIEQGDETRTVEQGHRIVLQVGEPLIEGTLEALEEEVPEADAAKTSPIPEEAPGEGAKSAPTGAGARPVPDGEPFEVGLSAGESATIHDARPPTRVGIRFDCAEGAQLEFARGGAKYGALNVRGRAHATGRLAPGSYRYRVRCLSGGRPGRLQHSGRVHVLADAATRKLPARAQRVTVDADGRNYRIQFENRLPRFTFTWRDAPPSEAYVLRVERGGRARFEQRASQPRVTLREGALIEGKYTYRFRTADEAATSKPTRLDVTFENTGGRTAYLAAVSADGNSAKGVRIRGGALAQSRVTVDGQPLRLDAQGRFDTRVPTPADAVVVVRVAHPSTGVHYYLRRLTAAP